MFGTCRVYKKIQGHVIICRIAFSHIKKKILELCRTLSGYAIIKRYLKKLQTNI